MELRVADITDAIEVHLSDSAAAEYQGKRIRVPVMVSGKDSTPYLCPKTVKCYCPEPGEGKKCNNCGLALRAGEIISTLDSSTRDLMKLIKCTDKQQLAAIKEVV